MISSVAAKDADTCSELRFVDAEGCRAVRSRQLIAWASAGAFRPVREFPLAEGQRSLTPSAASRKPGKTVIRTIFNDKGRLSGRLSTDTQA